MIKIKNIINLIFWKLYNFKKRYSRNKLIKNEFDKLSNKEIFTKIYKEKIWNRESQLEFDSGPGSHDIKVTKPYVKAILEFLKDKKNSAVIDLGCGDFNIGSQIYKHTKQYVAIDVVDILIQKNIKLYKSPNLTFKSLDITKNEIPSGDIILIKEVFQHITNDEIKVVLKKIINFNYLIVTESEPLIKFKPNIDKPKGPDCRTDIKSGIVIDKPPFNFKFKEKKILMKVLRQDRYISTVLYIN